MEELAIAFLGVLLQMSYFPSTSQQLREHTKLLAQLPDVLEKFNSTLGSPLVPLLLDVLWNVFETMPKPRTLPAVVCMHGSACVVRTPCDVVNCVNGTCRKQLEAQINM